MPWKCLTWRNSLLVFIAGGALAAGTVVARAGEQPPAKQASSDRPAYRVAERSLPSTEARAMLGAAQPNEHPLMPTLRWARDGLREMEKIKDYSATMVKRERIDGKVGDPEYIFLKVRHKPFSVYMYFLGPPAMKGQEVIWIEGANNGKMWAHGTGLRKVFGTVELDPTGPIAMKGNRYPATEVGIVNLLRRLIEVGERDTQYGECEVKFFPGAKINDRTHTCVQVVHPVPRRNFLFHVARIFVDDELNLPTRYESYDWPSQPGGPAELIEEYTYLNIKLNNGFTDADFDIRNPNYGFKAK
ncbi:MAG: DUF1571 domain-containing protein [Thermoguttaceae bacterium]|nr:DUF1571 domain-containing protein [Thermoguttaceae bacterium]